MGLDELKLGTMHMSRIIDDQRAHAAELHRDLDNATSEIVTLTGRVMTLEKQLAAVRVESAEILKEWHRTEQCFKTLPDQLMIAEAERDAARAVLRECQYDEHHRCVACGKHTCAPDCRYAAALGTENQP